MMFVVWFSFKTVETWVGIHTINNGSLKQNVDCVWRLKFLRTWSLLECHSSRAVCTSLVSSYTQCAHRMCATRTSLKYLYDMECLERCSVEHRVSERKNFSRRLPRGLFVVSKINYFPVSLPRAEELMEIIIQFYLRRSWGVLDSVMPSCSLNNGTAMQLLRYPGEHNM